MESNAPYSALSSITYSVGSAPGLYGLAPAIAWCLRQADLPPVTTTIGPVGTRIRYETDMTDVVATAPEGEAADRIVIRVLSTEAVQMAQQICYQLTTRILERSDAAGVYWGNTWRYIPATEFSWSALPDIPQMAGMCRLLGRVAAKPNLA